MHIKTTQEGYRAAKLIPIIGPIRHLFKQEKELDYLFKKMSLINGEYSAISFRVQYSYQLCGTSLVVLSPVQIVGRFGKI